MCAFMRAQSPFALSYPHSKKFQKTEKDYITLVLRNLNVLFL